MLDSFVRHPIEAISVAGIIILFVVAVGAHVKALQTVLGPEAKEADRLQKSLTEYGQLSDMQKDLLDDAREWIELNAPAPASKMLASVVATLRTPVTPAPGSVFFGFEGANTAARYLTGIFVFVGLFGTVAGIAASVGNLSTVVSVSDAAATSEQLGKVASSVRDLLGNMGVAFSCTLFGIGSTLLMSFCNAYYARREEAVLDKAEAVIQKQVVPLILRQQEIARNEKSVGSESAAHEYSPAQVTLMLGTTVQRLAAVVEPFQKSLTVLQKSTTTLADAVPKAADQLQVTLNSAEKLSTVFVAAASQLSDQTRQAAHLVEQAAVTAQKTGVITQEVLTRLEQAEAMLTRNSDHFGAISNGLKTAAETLSGAQSGLREDVRQAVVDMNKSVRQLQEELAADHQTQTVLQSRLVDNMAATDQRLKDLLAQFQMTLTEMTAIAGSSDLNREMRDFVQRLQELNTQSNDAQTRIAVATTTIEREAKRGADRDTRAERTDKTLESVSGQLSQLNKQMKSVETKVAVAAQASEILVHTSLEQRLARGWDKVTGKSKSSAVPGTDREA